MVGVRSFVNDETFSKYLARVGELEQQQQQRSSFSGIIMAVVVCQPSPDSKRSDVTSSHDVHTAVVIKGPARDYGGLQRETERQTDGATIFQSFTDFEMGSSSEAVSIAM